MVWCVFVQINIMEIFSRVCLTWTFWFYTSRKHYNSQLSRCCHTVLTSPWRLGFWTVATSRRLIIESELFFSANEIEIGRWSDCRLSQVAAFFVCRLPDIRCRVNLLSRETRSSRRGLIGSSSSRQLMGCRLTTIDDCYLRLKLSILKLAHRRRRWGLLTQPAAVVPRSTWTIFRAGGQHWLWPGYSWLF